MAKTLKDNYTSQRLERLQENVKKIDNQMLLETKMSQLITEVMNEKDLNTASAIIDKLRGMKGKGIGTLDSAIDKAVGQLNKYTGGGPIAQAWAKIKSTAGVDNPLVKIMTFANALEAGFKQIPQILKNNIGEITPELADKSIMDAIGDDEQKKTTITQNLLKALAPKGIFGAFKKIPFIDNGQLLVQDLMSAPLKGLNAIIKQSAAGPQTDQVATDLKDAIVSKGGAETKNATPAGVAAGSKPTVGNSPAQEPVAASGSTPTGETPPRVRVDTGNAAAGPAAQQGQQNQVRVADNTELVTKVTPALKNLGINNVDQVVAALDKLGVLKK